MIVEEWIGTPLRGADWRSVVKQSHQILTRIGVPYRCFTEHSGLITRAHMYLEFPSLLEREKFWSSPPSDFKAIVDKTADYWEMATFEHRYYNVFL